LPLLTVGSNDKILQMRVTLISIPVREQEKALNFYTEKLGFLIKVNQLLEDGNRWITLVSQEDPEGIEILLEPAPIHFEPTKVYQDALLEANLPYTQFDVDDVQSEYDRLIKLNVKFSLVPTKYGKEKVAVLNDTCGNNIQLVEKL
jgi:catechol 2,3-dioxygenase-like lactoylglutathione lyase family enzyme